MTTHFLFFSKVQVVYFGIENFLAETWNDTDIKNACNKTRLRKSKEFLESELHFLSTEVNSMIKETRMQQRKVRGFSVWSKAEFSNTKLLPSTKQVRNKKDKQLLICPQCFYSTFVPQRMTNHEKTHTGDRPHKCNFCGRGFVLKSSLTNHLKTHSNQIAKSIKCENSKWSIWEAFYVLHGPWLWHSNNNEYDLSCSLKNCSCIIPNESHFTGLFFMPVFPVFWLEFIKIIF